MMKSFHNNILTLLGVGLLQLSSPVQALNESSLPCGTPIIDTLNGSFYGSHSARFNVDSFLGIPYAQPPVGALRYQQPQSLNTTWSGLKNATQYGYQCVGYGGDTYRTPINVSEDCLTLNIVRPSGYEDQALPVAIWIHGGNYQQGSSAVQSYNLTWIVQASVESKNPMIAVSINYRLHTWGFLFSQEMKDEKVGNLGLRDQRMAFQWVQDNIAAFGGDPTKVTIWGESAGAGSVGMHLVAYNGTTEGLFRAAIMESGASISWSQYGNMTKYQAVYDVVTNATGCANTTNSLQCLRELPFETLNAVLNSSIINPNLQYPVIDDDFLLQSGSAQLKSGQFVKVPIIIGMNFDEGASFAPRNVNTSVEFRDYIVSNGISTNNTAVDALLLLYPDIPDIGIPATFKGRRASVGLQWKRCASIVGDVLMHAPRRVMTEIWASNNLTSYSYHFNVIPAGGPLAGASHATELGFVFNNVGASSFALAPASYKEVARLMSRQWISFVVNLDPNLSGVTSPTWPVYDNMWPNNYVFDANVSTLAYLEPDYYRAEAINYFKENFNTPLFDR